MRTYSTSPLYTRQNAFDGIVRLSSRRITPIWNRFVRVEKTSNIKYIAGTQSGFGAAPVVLDGDNYTTQDFATPFRREYDIVKYGFMFPVTTLAEGSDPYKLIQQRTPLMLKSINTAVEFDMAEFVNLATSAVTCPDGVVLASASHLRLGGTFSNILTGNPVLSYNAVSLAKQAMTRFVNHEGEPDPRMGPYNLIVPPELEFIAKEIEQSPDRPDTADRAKNVVSSQINVIVNPYLTSTTAWALVQASEEDNPLLMALRRDVENNVADWRGINDSWMYSINKVWAKLPKDARGFVYSSGAGS